MPEPRLTIQALSKLGSVCYQIKDKPNSAYSSHYLETSFVMVNTTKYFHCDLYPGCKPCQHEEDDIDTNIMLDFSAWICPYAFPNLGET